MRITGERIFLRKLALSDITDRYLSWMNDYEVVKYTESRHINHTKKSLTDFILSIDHSSNYFFAIIDKYSEKHIGNIKIGNINSIHKFAEVGLIIGDKKFWNRGIATEAISLCVNFSFEELELHRLSAGVYEPNIGSMRAFEKAGFVKESCEKEKYIFEGNRINSFIYSIINECTSQ